MNRRTVLTFLVLAAACGDGGGPGPDTRPTDVVIVAGSRGQGQVTLALRNDGGPGSYKVEFWGVPPGGVCTVQNCATHFYGDTDPVEIPAGYRETLAWSVPVAVTRAIVFSRRSGTAVWTETDRWDTP